jgi:hypothetical protein
VSHLYYEALRDAILYGKKVNTHGGDRKSEQVQGNNVTLKSDRGNSETYTVRKLRKERPEAKTNDGRGATTICVR